MRTCTYVLVTGQGGGDPLPAHEHGHPSVLQPQLPEPVWLRHEPGGLTEVLPGRGALHQGRGHRGTARLLLTK